MIISSLYNYIYLIYNKHFIRNCLPIIKKINTIAKSFQNIPIDKLKNKTIDLQNRYTNGEILNNLLPESFALVKYASECLFKKKIIINNNISKWKMIHYDIQFIGGIALHYGHIIEVATGEGKTLIATCPLYLNSLTQKKCYLITINDYLASRDAEWIGYLYNILGLKVGCLTSKISLQKRPNIYKCNIIYSTTSEIIFDFLRNNGNVLSLNEIIYNNYYYCIIDEIDSILIDEAMDPLIISNKNIMQYNINKKLIILNSIKFDLLKIFKKQQQLINKLCRKIKKSNYNFFEKQISQIYLILQKSQNINSLLFDKIKYNNFKHRQQPIEKFNQNNKQFINKIENTLFFIYNNINKEIELTKKGILYFNKQVNSYLLNDFIFPKINQYLLNLLKISKLDNIEKNRKKAYIQLIYRKKNEKLFLIKQLLIAFSAYKKNLEYILKNKKILILNKKTGRYMFQKQWNHGLHKAIECKENIFIKNEYTNISHIRIPDFFKIYTKLSGMTGTATINADELKTTYGLYIIKIPTKTKNIRKNLKNQIFKTNKEKYHAIIKYIFKIKNLKYSNPILIITKTINNLEILSKKLNQKNIHHSILHAKNSQKESNIIKTAGKTGTITISTNILGRGTDIQITNKVQNRGGLILIISEKSACIKIDQQLKGRCSRHGFPGIVQFFISLEDNLIHKYKNLIKIILLCFKIKKFKIIIKNISEYILQYIQKKIERYNQYIRHKSLTQNNLDSQQQIIIHSLRKEAILTIYSKYLIFSFIKKEIFEKRKNMTNYNYFLFWIYNCFHIKLNKNLIIAFNQNVFINTLCNKINQIYKEKHKNHNKWILKKIEKFLIINGIDYHYHNLIIYIQEIKNNIFITNKKSLIYKKECIYLFYKIIIQIRQYICKILFHIN